MKPTEKGIWIRDNIYFWQDAFLMRHQVKSNGQEIVTYEIYKKYDKGKCENFWFATNSLKTVRDTLELLREELPHTIVSELHPEYKEIEYTD